MSFPLVTRRKYNDLLTEAEEARALLWGARQELQDKDAELRHVRCELETYKNQWAKVLLENTILTGGAKHD